MILLIGAFEKLANHKFLLNGFHSSSFLFKPAYIPRRELPKLNAFGLSLLPGSVLKLLKDKVKELCLIDKNAREKRLTANVGEEVFEFIREDALFTKRIFEEHMRFRKVAFIILARHQIVLLQFGVKITCLKVGECLKKARGSKSLINLQP
ncbi:hypothetical protein CUMW_204520 [Citrus unshiu]|uniref:Uncharacterized protein n=1 Tax=Citrus unshiu TaxID=55188 RepID=A0A2H5Q7Z1_CITUN|nr:hypothetical protein CUMW_204520 [Citrus unshiu]